MVDIGALKAHLEANFATELSEGATARLVTLLNEPEAIAPAKKFIDVPVADFLDIVATESLSAAEEDRIRTYTQGRDTVPTSKPAVRTWLQGVLSATAISALRALGEKERTVAEVAGIAQDSERVSLVHVRRAARMSSISHVAQYEAASRVATADRIARLEAAGLTEATTPANAAAKANA